MDTILKEPIPETFEERQRAALLTLLADEDPNVFRSVREKIFSLGPAAYDWLRPHTLSRDPVLRRHAQQIVRHFARQAADNRFLAFCLGQGEELDLEQGIWLLAQTQYPDINTEAYGALLDSYAADVCERTVLTGPGKKILSGINQYLFGELGFSGNDLDYHDPANSYLNCVMDRRTGNAISLGVVYLLLARRLRLPITGIGVPGHFVCRYQSAAEEIYIDPFHQGRLMTKAHCVQYLLRGYVGLQDHYLTPLTARRILMRLCTELHRVYYHFKQDEEITRLQRYMVALAR